VEDLVRYVLAPLVALVALVTAGFAAPSGVMAQSIGVNFRGGQADNDPAATGPDVTGTAGEMLGRPATSRSCSTPAARPDCPALTMTGARLLTTRRESSSRVTAKSSVRLRFVSWISSWASVTNCARSPASSASIRAVSIVAATVAVGYRSVSNSISRMRWSRISTDVSTLSRSIVTVALPFPSTPPSSVPNECTSAAVFAFVDTNLSVEASGFSTQSATAGALARTSRVMIASRNMRNSGWCRVESNSGLVARIRRQKLECPAPASDFQRRHRYQS